MRTSYADPRTALMLTLIENCRRLAGANPEEHLADVLRRVDGHPASVIAGFVVCRRRF